MLAAIKKRLGGGSKGPAAAAPGAEGGAARAEGAKAGAAKAGAADAPKAKFDDASGDGGAEVYRREMARQARAPSAAETGALRRLWFPV